MKFNSKKNLLVAFFMLLSHQTLKAQDEMILITYDEHVQMATWLQTMMTGPSINAPEQVVELKQTKDPCEAQPGRLMHICVDGEFSYKLVVIKSAEIKEAFAHLVPVTETIDPEAKRQWEAMWAGKADDIPGVEFIDPK